MDRREKKQPRNVAGQDPDYYLPNYSNAADSGTPYEDLKDEDISELDKLHEEMNQVKKDRKYKKHLDLLKSQDTTPVLDMDMGKGEVEDYAETIDQIQKDKSNIRNTPSQLDKDRANIRNTPVEEEEDDWWSNMQARLSEIGDWFGAGSSNTGMLGGQDRNVRLSNKWKSGQVPRAKGR
jgi:hypothetical protein